MNRATILREFGTIDAERKRRALAKRGVNVDPVAFAHECGMTAEPWQVRALRWSEGNGKRLLLNCSRQAGKSTITAVLALHRALTVKDALILLVSPSLRQSRELLLKVRTAVRECPYGAALTEDNKLSLTFSNGARIVSLPSSEDTIRGFSAVNLIIEDEAAFVDDALNVAVRPMLAVSAGQLILMSTPKGRRGHFFEAWERGGPEWERIQATAAEIPRISPEFLAAEREDMSRRGLRDLYEQEYECRFVNAAAGRVYGAFDEVRNCLAALPDNGRGTWNHVLGIDFGIVDQNACTVLAWRSNDPTVYVRESYRLTAIPSEMAAEVKRLDETYKFARIVGDVGGQGKAFAEEMRQRHSIPVEPAEKQNKVGTISLLNGDLSLGRVKVVRSTCGDLVSEWLELPWADGYEGRKESDGFANHASDSCLYAWRACPAYAERVPDAGPTLGSPEFFAAQEREMLDADLKRVEAEREERDVDWFQELGL